jgi:dihydroxy-acid dehydratase
MTEASLRNAVVALQAIGGSTNALIHLAAIMGRVGIDLNLEEVDAIGREVDVMVDIKPSGTGYMEDLHRAGGMPRVLAAIAERLSGDALTVTGKPLSAGYEQPTEWSGPAMHRAGRADGALAILRGNLAPRGAVIKVAAASPELLVHRGRAVVFDSVQDLVTRIDRDDLGASPSDVLVLRNAGPLGGPGMPEAGQIPIPRSLARAGVRDMVRISDARMSGTSFGTVVVHVAPEAAVGGPLAGVRDGDAIALDVPGRRLDVLITDEELQRRLSALAAPVAEPARGYSELYRRSVLQADQGCDFDFLRAVG